MKCHIVDIGEIRAESRQQAIDNAWAEYMTAIRESVEANKKVNDKHNAWMKLCSKAVP